MKPYTSSQKKRLGIISRRGHFYITRNGSWIAADVKPDAIAESAIIGADCFIAGEKTLIEEHVHIESSYIADAQIKRGARIQNSVVRGVPDTKKWSFAPKSPYRVNVSKTVIGKNACVEGFSVLENVLVGANSSVDQSVVQHSKIGTENIIKGAKVILVHTEKDVQILGPTEVAESWLGWALVIDRSAYVEGIFPNEIISARFHDGRLETKRIAGIPQTTIMGERMICSGYSGEAVPPNTGTLTAVTGAEHSLHGTPVIAPLAILAPDIRLIARTAHPDLSSATPLEERDLTYLMSFSLVGCGGAEHWGWALPGEKSTGLSFGDKDAPWVFEYAPDIIIRLIEQAYHKAPEKTKAVIDSLPEECLRTGRALVEKELWVLRKQQKKHPKKNAKKNARRIAQLETFRAAYEKHLSSGAWKFKQGKPLFWTFDQTAHAWVSEKIVLSQQVFMSEILPMRKNSGSLRRTKELMQECREEPKKKIRTSRSISRDAFIGPGAKVLGASRVEAGAVIIGATVKDAYIKKNAHVLFSSVKSSCVEKEAHVMASLIEQSRVDTRGDICGAEITRSQLGEDDVVEPLAECRDVTSDGGNSFGSPLRQANCARGFVDHHAVSCVHGIATPEIEVRHKGKLRLFPNVTNIGAGTRVGLESRREGQAVCESAFLASNSMIEKGAHIAFGSFIKGFVGAHEKIYPFTFKNDKGQLSLRGPVSDVLAGTLNYPGVILRHLISKTKKALPPEKRARVDMLIEEKIRETRELLMRELINMDQMGSTKTASGHTRKQVLDGITRCEEHLDGRWYMEDGAFTNGAWVWDAEHKKYAWQPRALAGAVKKNTLQKAYAPQLVARSFSGVRSTFGQGAISPELSAIIARYAYHLGKHIIAKWRKKTKKDKTVRVIIAADPRPSRRMITTFLIKGLALSAHEEQATIHCIDMKILPTPAFEDAVRYADADGGIMITASHNPLEQNGIKFSCGNTEPAGALLANGALLGAHDMMDIIHHVDAWVSSSQSAIDEFTRHIDSGFEKETIIFDSIDEQYKRRQGTQQHYLSFLANILLLPDEGARANVQDMARDKGVRFIVDPNGGAACGMYAAMVRGMFGQDAREIHNEYGVPKHKIEPVGDALKEMRAELKRAKNSVGLVTDFDGDRGIVLMSDARGTVTELPPQDMAAFQAAMYLSWHDLIMGDTGKPRAIVVNGPTSGRIEKIAAVFSARVARVEVGEINVIEQAERLREEGYDVPFMSEGSNGGVMFGASKVRDGLASLLFAGLVMCDRRIWARWLEKSEQCFAKKNIEDLPETYSVADIMATLPKYSTLNERITEKADAGSIKKVKARMEQIFYERFWDAEQKVFMPALQAYFKEKNVREVPYTSWRVVYTQALARGKEVVIRKPSVCWGAGIVDDAGGWKIEFLVGEEVRSFLWLRPSRTEPGKIFNIIADSPEKKETAALFELLKDLYRKGKTRNQ